MYWADVLYVVDWCVVCTGLACCMYWTGVLYVLDWCVLNWFVVCSGLVCYVYITGLDCFMRLGWGIAPEALNTGISPSNFFN